jgi:hypothetical protein
MTSTKVASPLGLSCGDLRHHPNKSRELNSTIDMSCSMGAGGKGHNGSSDVALGFKIAQNISRAASVMIHNERLKYISSHIQ